MRAGRRVLGFGVAVVFVALAGGCGSSGKSSQPSSAANPPPASSATPRSAQERANTGHAGKTAVGTIRGWVEAERQSDDDRAAQFFSLPVIALNGPQPVLLRTRDAVKGWNASLPCGAVLLRAVDVRGWTVARFRLIDRPGVHCDGTGHTASTAFAMRHGLIALWVRVRDDVSPQRAAPPRPPDQAFIRRGTVPGVPSRQQTDHSA